MKLYYSPGACSMSPHIVAKEAGIPLELVKVDIHGTTKTEDGEDLYKINHKGYVPLLELDDGRRIAEGPVVVQYLADLKPESGLIPASGFERYKVLEWLSFINSEIHKSFEQRPDDIPIGRQRSSLNRHECLLALYRSE